MKMKKLFIPFFCILCISCEKTEALLKAYESELRDGFHARSIASIKNLMRANGSIINAEFAEKFMIIKEII